MGGLLAEDGRIELSGDVPEKELPGGDLVRLTASGMLLAVAEVLVPAGEWPSSPGRKALRPLKVFYPPI